MEKITQRQLNQVVERIVSAVHPETVYLYGSHAYGEPHKHSDVDILVVVPDTDEGGSTYRKAVETYASLRGLMIPAEIKVETSSEFEERSHWPATIEREVREKGDRLYAASD